MENKDIAKAVIEAIGGRDNVSSVAHCATRLRVMVKDEAKIDKDRVENLEKVQGAFFNSGQYQIIFGTGTVNKIYDEVVALGLPTSSTGEQKAEAAKKGNWFQRAVRTFGDVFVLSSSIRMPIPRYCSGTSASGAIYRPGSTVSTIPGSRIRERS